LVKIGLCCDLILALRLPYLLSFQLWIFLWNCWCSYNEHLFCETIPFFSSWHLCNHLLAKERCLDNVDNVDNVANIDKVNTINNNYNVNNISHYLQLGSAMKFEKVIINLYEHPTSRQVSSYLFVQVIANGGIQLDFNFQLQNCCSTYVLCSLLQFLKCKKIFNA
jgi:hypothetical protein